MAPCGPSPMAEGARVFHYDRPTRMLRARAGLVLCAALVTDGAIAAPPTLQSVAVTPTGASILVGETQSFTANGAFSDGSIHTCRQADGAISAMGECHGRF